MINNDISGTAEISDEGIKKHFKSIDPQEHFGTDHQYYFPAHPRNAHLTLPKSPTPHTTCPPSPLTR